MIKIKPMETAEEIRGKAYVVFRGWHDSYPGMIDDVFLDQLTLEKCIEISFARPTDTLVALDEEGNIIGFATYCACRDEDLADTGEIQAIYVLKEYQAMHVGSGLMRECLKKLSGYSSAAVWTLAENRKAISFYEHMGFRKDGVTHIRSIGSPVKEIRLIRDLSDYRD